MRNDLNFEAGIFQACGWITMYLKIKKGKKSVLLVLDSGLLFESWLQSIHILCLNLGLFFSLDFF